jgi:hypothetical protein
VDCSVDENGVATSVATVGHERWLAVFLQFDRVLDDERVDGNGQAVFFVRNESYKLVVRQGASAAAGDAVRVALDDEMLLVCDVKRSQGVNTILNAVIDTTRRQGFVHTDAEHIELAEHVWSLITSSTVQGALEEIDAYLDGDLRDQADANKGAALIGFAAEGGLDGLAAGTLRDALIELSDKVTAHKAALTAGAHSTSNINGLSITTGTVNITGDPLNDYLLALQTWIYSNVARRLGSGTEASLAAGGTSTIIAGLAQAPTSVKVRAAKTTWAANDWLLHGTDIVDADWSLEEIAVESHVQGGGTYNVIVKNNSSVTLRIYVEAYRVG